MNFVRKVTNSDALKHIIDLPEALRNQEVELIILPIEDPDSQKHITSVAPAARGALKQYANMDMLQHEQDAWAKGVQDEHNQIDELHNA